MLERGYKSIVKKTDLSMTYPNAPSLPAGEAFATAPEASAGNVSRRALLLGIAGVGFTHALDEQITDVRWAQNETQLQVYETHGARNGIGTFVVPGLGVQSGEGIMRALMPAFQSGQYAGYIRYSDNELEVDRIPDLINRAQHRLGFSGIVLYLHSMAGAMAPDIIERLDESVRVHRIDYNCSPWTADYVFDKELVDILSKLPLDGSYGTKLLAQIIERFGRSQNADKTTLENVRTAWRTTNDDGSPETWMEQLRFLKRNQLERFGSMSENIDSRFFGPADISSDRIVALAPTIRTYSDYIPGRKQVVAVDCRGHANPKQHPREYIEALQPIEEVLTVSGGIQTPRVSYDFDRRNV